MPSGQHVTLTNIVVGMAQAWTAPALTPQVADTVLLDTDYPTPWVPLGATEQGVSLARNPSVSDIRVEELSTPALVVKTSEDINVNFVVAEDTLDVMKLAYGGGTKTVQAPSLTLPGVSKLQLSDGMDQLAVGFDGINAFGFYRRCYIPKVVSIASVTTAYRRAAAPRLYTVSLRAICKMTDIVIEDMTAVHT